MILRVPERGSLDLGTSEWSLLRSHDAFWRLVDARIVSVTAGRSGKATLNGTSFVGRASIGALTLECSEKVPGALLGLLATTSASFRGVTAPAPATDLGETVQLLVEAFVSEVRRYVGAGRDWRYEDRRYVSSLIGGRLHLPSTVHLRARGITHKVAFDRSEISHATPTNRVVLAGLREVEVLAGLVHLPAKMLTAARTMALFFEDCRDDVVMFGERSDLADTARDLADVSARAEDELMLSLASVLLTHTSFEVAETKPGTVPLSWFVNLERLFEKAVIEALAVLTPDSVRVSKGGPLGKSTFSSGLLAADPDLVVRGVTTCIGDVKYKSWSKTAAPSDLYQLLVHAAVFRSGEAFLVYPSDAYEEVDLGDAVTDTHVRLFAVDIRDVANGVAEIWNAMKLKYESAVPVVS